MYDNLSKRHKVSPYFKPLLIARNTEGKVHKSPPYSAIQGDINENQIIGFERFPEQKCEPFLTLFEGKLQCLEIPKLSHLSVSPRKGN